MHKSIHFFLAFTLLLSATACNLQTTTQPTLSVDDQAATIIAATLQAQPRNVRDVPITTTFSPTPKKAF
jgi:hypothetical protein